MTWYKEILSSPNAFLKPLFQICNKTHLSALGGGVVGKEPHLTNMQGPFRCMYVSTLVKSYWGCPVEPRCARAQCRVGRTRLGCWVITEPKSTHLLTREVQTEPPAASRELQRKPHSSLAGLCDSQLVSTPHKITTKTQT